MRTIKKLVTDASKQHVYFYLKNETVGKQFLSDAQSEGFTLGGKPLSGVIPEDIFAVRADMTVCYCNSISYIAFQCGGDNILCVDYEKFRAGDSDYLFKNSQTLYST